MPERLSLTQTDGIGHSEFLERAVMAAFWASNPTDNGGAVGGAHHVSIIADLVPTVAEAKLRLPARDDVLRGTATTLAG